MRGVQERRAVGSPLKRTGRRSSLIAGVGAGTLGLDLLTKWWALRTLTDHDIHVIGSLRLALTRNAGGAFGLAAVSSRNRRCTKKRSRSRSSPTSAPAPP